MTADFIQTQKMLPDLIHEMMHKIKDGKIKVLLKNTEIPF